MIRCARVVWVLLGLLGAPVVAAGQTASAPSGLMDQIKNGTLDVAVPSSPAFAILGLSPDTVVRPASPRGLATSLLNGVDASGRLQTGVALDTTPYMLVAGSRVTFRQYRDRYALRLLARSQISVATASGGTGDGRAVVVGLGGHFTLFDLGDARGDAEFARTLVALGEQVLLANPPPPPDAGEGAIDTWRATVAKQAAALAQPLRDARRKQAWNRSSMTVGVAGSWRSADATFSSLRHDGTAIWTSIAYGFEGVPGLEKAGQLIVHARRRTSAAALGDPSAPATAPGATSLAGLSARFGTEKATALVELVYQSAPAASAGQPAERDWRFSLGAEFRAIDNLWLQVAMRAEPQRAPGGRPRAMVLLTQIKWVFSQE